VKVMNEPRYNTQTDTIINLGELYPSGKHVGDRTNQERIKQLIDLQDKGVILTPAAREEIKQYLKNRVSTE
jgi:Ca2+-binding EF-hand superfamily protein